MPTFPIELWTNPETGEDRYLHDFEDSALSYDDAVAQATAEGFELKWEET
jgi:hypothetical protein